MKNFEEIYQKIYSNYNDILENARKEEKKKFLVKY